jgi:tetratricopeptide (TPR) repeat protein
LAGAGLSVGAALLVLAALAAPRWLAQTRAVQAVQAGETRLAAGDYQLAVDAFAAALAADPQNIAALAGRLRAREALLQIDDARADAEAWIAAAPNDGLAYAERARLNVQYLALEDPAAVLADLDHAVELAPDSARAHFLRGWAILNFPLLNDVPDPTSALPDLQRAAALAPADAEMHYTLAQALLAAGLAAEAQPVAGRAAELDPTSPRYWTIGAHIWAVLGDFVAAVDDLSRALKVETEPAAQAVLLAERAYLHHRLGSPAEAEADAAQALARDSASALAQVVAALARGERPPAEALQAARTAPGDDPIWRAILDEAGT